MFPSRVEDPSTIKEIKPFLFSDLWQFFVLTKSVLTAHSVCY